MIGSLSQTERLPTMVRLGQLSPHMLCLKISHFDKLHARRFIFYTGYELNLSTCVGYALVLQTNAFFPSIQREVVRKDLWSRSLGWVR